MAHAMYCVMNHDVWSRTRDLASQSLFPLSLISSLVGTVNEMKLMSALIDWCTSSSKRLQVASGWRGTLQLCNIALL